MGKWINLMAWGLLVGCVGSAQAQVDVAVDLLDRFEEATVIDSSSCAVRIPGLAGAAKKNALFEHPETLERPARVEYGLELPPAGPGERLILAFDIALSDGIPVEGSPYAWDGVRFGIEVDGQQLFERDCKQMRWQSHAVDLTPYEGRTVTLSLLTGALGNLAYDWALWGDPRILHFTGSLLQAPGRASVTAGALALAYRPGSGLTVRVRPVGGGEGVEWTGKEATAPADQTAWVALDFAFPQAEGVEVDWEPRDAVPAEQVWLAGYPTRLMITHLTPVRAVPLAGEPVTLRAEVKNAGRGGLQAGAASLELTVDGRTLPVLGLPPLPPGASCRGEWEWTTPAQPGRWQMQVSLREKGMEDRQAVAVLETFPAPMPGNLRGLQNEHLRLEFVQAGEGYAYARVSARREGEWVALGVWRPLMKVVLDTPAGDVEWEIRPQRLQRSAPVQPGEAALECDERVRDPEGVEWRLQLRIALDPERPLARLQYRWQVERDRRLRAVWGPQLYAGDGSWGAAKIWGLFPGLEYLYKGERSSNPRDLAPPLDDRRTPHPHKVTVPLMAISVGPGGEAPPEDADFFYCSDSLKDMQVVSGRAPQLREEPLTLALMWDPLQRWDGEHDLPSARFASPNFDQAMDNHRMGLFLPSVPDFVQENDEEASEPYSLPAGRPLALEAQLLALPGPATMAIREWVREVGGLPQPHPWPRPLKEELDLCRVGFLESVGDDPLGRFRHAVGWEHFHVPGYLALLWMDGQLAPDEAGRQASRERVELSVESMLAEMGPGYLASRGGCHVMRWEFPFLYGYLPEALDGLEGEIRGLIQSQQPDGGWRFGANPEGQQPLGVPGDATMGVATHNAWMLLRYARVTGDQEALQAGEKALLFMERFRVPRGSSVWECPWYEPDLVATTWGLASCLEGYRATGNPRWLHDAVYWAETGVPFIYLWTLPDRPMMLGASIPVFGSTFYTHSWLKMPVQWEGLMYAYHLHHLAEALEQGSPRTAASPLTTALEFTPQDWRRMAELMTVSGLYQQVDEDGPLKGTYPDSITDFQQRNPVFINPEDILVNVFTLQGHDPDIKSVRLRAPQGTILVSSGADIENLQASPGSVRFRLRFFPGESSHTLVVGATPVQVMFNGQPLPRAAEPLRRSPGWWWDADQERLYVTAMHGEEEAEVEVRTEE